MTNHVHLAIQVGEIPLSRIVQNISFRYARYMNRRRKRVGHLFQGRYIHNNPVRAGMVKTADKYAWVSHQAYLGKVSVPWLTTDWALSQFAKQKKRAVALCCDFIMEGKGEEHRKEFYQGNVEGRILGKDRFAEDALGKASQKATRKATLEQVLEAVCKHYSIKQAALASGSREKRVAEPRALAALLVRETDHLSLMNLSRKLKHDLSGLSQSASRLEKKLEKDKVLGKKINKIKELIG